ncbi:hypothetical protein ABVT39_000008 [Epinephelus coioides]
MTEQSALLLRKQLAELNKNPVEGFSAGLIDDDDIYKWEVVIIGPQDTLFEGGFFKAYLTFPYDYPLRPPKMKFITEIWHPNVAKNGDVCISILHEPGEDKFGYEKPEERWLPIHTVETIMISVISMLADPNSDSPANVDAASASEGDAQKNDCERVCRQPAHEDNTYSQIYDVCTLLTASSPYSWTETLPVQYSKRLQYRAHEAADEAALFQCAAHMCSVRSESHVQKELALRSVNSTHSAYACFLFSPLFFQHYSLGSVSEQSSETIKCKLVMKSVLPLFRCLTSIERNVEQCQISISTPNDRVTIQFFCRHGITKTHNLCFQESEALQAVFAAHLCPNVLKAPARLLGDMVTHFPVSQEEITLSVTPLRVSLRNYHEGGNDHLKFMYTEMSLHPDEFDYFQIGMESDITFCLKELRGLLSFAESHCLPVSVYFTAAGKPVCFSVEDVVLEATVVLATLIDSESRGPSQPTETLAPTTLSCADAAVLPVGSCEADSSKAQGIPAEMEMVASSQGSPIINPPALMLRLPQTDNPDGLGVDDETCASVTTTPASSMICSLLFKALSSEQDTDGCAVRLPVLACYSDGEENVEEDFTRSPSL